MSASSVPPEVLLADDDDVGRYVVATSLRRSGFSVREVADGDSAIATALAAPPDAIVLDVKMPGRDGFDVCAALKQHPRTAAVPILLLSATFLESEYQVRGLESGADAYLTQPVETPVLNATVRALLRTRLAERQVRLVAEEWQTTFDAISDAVCVLDPAGRIVRANQAFIALAPGLDESADSTLGAVLPELATILHAGSGGELRHRGRHHAVRRHEVHDPEASTEHVVLTLTDVTAERRVEHERAAAQQRDRAIARLLQRSLLPDGLPQPDGWQLAGRHLAFGIDSLVGGDWYEAIRIDEHALWLVMGDVAGHGVETAARANALRHSLRIYAREGYTPAGAMAKLNEILLEDELMGLATVALAGIDLASGDTDLVIAGHPPPIIVTAAGEAVTTGGARGPVLGVPDTTWPTQPLTLDPGDRLLLYTDGLVERRGEDINLGLARLATACETLPEELDDAAAHLLRTRPAGAELADDVAVLIAGRRRAPGGG
ncbi:SpoIIE family protein phosphatase [Paraconexibacter antarcticus]|uniref:SpoIIE family protein phosphatase n=1 Tax=Paraconexibacter antarcticus TaxID=2949664 RepID=A0ABY5DYR3_9ACTN|nr:SpoIIE family protein phosphatase [Paraconexibacter antarcticus]UTI66836.1 SpoIIE family protein phosphatase [Paraconexibacter antarcticus]